MTSIARLLGLLAVGLVLVSFAAQASAGEPASPVDETNILRKTLEAQGYVCIEIERMRSNFFTTEVEFGKHTLRLAVDTGAFVTCFDPTRTKALGIPWTADDPAVAVKPNEHCVVDALKVGPVTTSLLKALPFDLTEHNEGQKYWGDAPCDGVLGLEVLTARSAVIDYPNNRMFLLPTGAKPSLAEADAVRKRLGLQGYVCIELLRDRLGHLTKVVQANSIELHLLVDTGTATTFLDYERTSELGLRWRSNDDFFTGKGSPKDTVLIESLAIGPIRTGRLWASPYDLQFNNGKQTALKAREFDGILGNDVLMKHAAVIDVAGQRCFLLPKGRR